MDAQVVDDQEHLALHALDQILQEDALEDREILVARHQTYLQAYQRNPALRPCEARDWTPVGAVTLNPERKDVLRDHIHAKDIGRLVA